MAQSLQKIRHFSVSIIFILFLALFFESVAPNEVVKLELVEWNKTKFDDKQQHLVGDCDDETKTYLAKLIDQGYEIAAMTEKFDKFLFVLVNKNGKHANANGTDEPKAVVQLELGGNDDQTKKTLADWIDQGYEIAGMTLCKHFVNINSTFFFAYALVNVLKKEYIFGHTWNIYAEKEKEKLEKPIDEGYKLTGMYTEGNTNFLVALVNKGGTKAKPKTVVQFEIGGKYETEENFEKLIKQDGYEFASMAEYRSVIFYPSCSHHFLFALVKKNGTEANSKTVVQFVLGQHDDQTKKTLADWIDQGFEIAGMAASGTPPHQFLFAFVKKTEFLGLVPIAISVGKKQIDALWHKIKQHNDTLVKNITILNGKLDEIVNGIGTLVKQSGKKSGK